MLLFEAGKIGSMMLKNRVVMTPMGIYGLPDHRGMLTQKSIDFYTARAKGGAGLIFPTATQVTRAFEEDVSVTYAIDSIDKALKWSELAEDVHHYGGRLGIQLSAGLGRVNSSFVHDPYFEPISASPVDSFWAPMIRCRALEISEIEFIIDSYAQAAIFARDAGVDVIEIHGYGGYLLDQFMTSAWNEREDEYGGSLENRMRFPIEAYRKVRAVVGEDYPVIFKFTPVHLTPEGREMAEGIEIAKMLESEGVDALHVDVGCYESWHRTIPPVYAKDASQADIAGMIRDAVNIPIICQGKLADPEVAESVLAEGKCDFVGLGRAFLADPEWPNKVKAGRANDIAPCIGCSEGCFMRTMEGRYASCAVNPTCSQEKKYSLRPARNRKTVLVIGGGPGGMEAAITAAARGHEVCLWEKTDELGGYLIPASVPQFKKDVRRLISHLEHRLECEGVEVVTGKHASPDSVINANADAVIIATGSEPLIPDIPGIDGRNVMTAIDVLNGKSDAGQNVVVAGGGIVGCETALYLAGYGKNVSIVEMQFQLVPEGIFIINYAELEKQLADFGVRVFCDSKVAEIRESGVSFESWEKMSNIDCDTVVLALGLKPVNSLFYEIGEGLDKYIIGDAVKPRKVLDAVWEGFHISRLL